GRAGSRGWLHAVTAELFKMMTGTDMLLVSYRGVAPAATDLLGGQVQVMFNSLPASIEDIKAGTLRALGGTSESRSETLPGPLQDQIGLLAALRPRERVLVLLQLLGGQQRVELARGAIEVVE